MMGLADISHIAKNNRVYLNTDFNTEEFEPPMYYYPSSKAKSGIQFLVEI